MKRKLSLKIPTVLSLLLLWMSVVIIGVQATGAPGLKELSWVVGGEEGSGGERIPAWQAGSLRYMLSATPPRPPISIACGRISASKVAGQRRFVHVPCTEGFWYFPAALHRRMFSC